MEPIEEQTMSEVYGVDALCCYDCLLVLTSPEQVHLDPSETRCEMARCQACYEKLPVSTPQLKAKDASAEDQMLEIGFVLTEITTCDGCGVLLDHYCEDEYREGFWCSRECAYAEAQDR